MRGLLPTRDFHPPLNGRWKSRFRGISPNAHKTRIRKLSNKRLYIPAEEPYMEGHNTWIANHEGLHPVIPVGDSAQHTAVHYLLFTQ